MNLEKIATALRRVERIFAHSPEKAKGADSSAHTVWKGGTQVLAMHDNGTRMTTNMSCEFGGTGEGVTPGWLFRAGIAACMNTTIVLTAAAQEITLDSLEVSVTSRTDARGILGMQEAEGGPIYAGPGDMRLQVRIASREATAKQLQELVALSLKRSPIPNAVMHATPLALDVTVLDLVH